MFSSRDKRVFSYILFSLLNITRNNYIAAYRSFFTRSYQNLILLIILFYYYLNILYICSVRK